MPYPTYFPLEEQHTNPPDKKSVQLLCCELYRGGGVMNYTDQNEFNFYKWVWFKHTDGAIWVQSDPELTCIIIDSIYFYSILGAFNLPRRLSCEAGGLPKA